MPRVGAEDKTMDKTKTDAGFAPLTKPAIHDAPLDLVAAPTKTGAIETALETDRLLTAARAANAAKDEAIDELIEELEVAYTCDGPLPTSVSGVIARARAARAQVRS